MTINPITVSSQNTKFNGIKRTQRGVNYHHTNAGLAVGSAVSLLAAGLWTSNSKGFNVNDISYLRQMGFKEKDIIAMVKQAEKLKQRALPCGIIAAAASIGCGIIIDLLRNKKAQKIAEQSAIQGPQQTCMTNPDARLTSFGTVYHHSNEGKKTGALLGVACGLAHSLMLGNPVNLPVYLTFALGGFLAGAITDKISNNKAKENPTFY